jgi:hypothetical protein
MTSAVNWIAAYNYLFAAFNSENRALYVSGATFCRMPMKIDKLSLTNPRNPAKLTSILR